MSLPYGAMGWSAVCVCSISFGMPSKLLKEADLSKQLKGCLCSMSLLYGAIGWLAVCDCSILFGMPSKLLKEADLSR